jgi:subtilisin family serine protease
VRVAVIDSGITPCAETGPVAGGISFVDETWTDRLGHGTWVAATIREYAPEADLFAVKIFGRRLETTMETLLRAMQWAEREGMDIANLSMGTREALPAMGGMLVVTPDGLPEERAAPITGLQAPSGVSFAVARLTGRLAAAWRPGISREEWLRSLEA